MENWTLNERLCLPSQKFSPDSPENAQHIVNAQQIQKDNDYVVLIIHQ